LNIFFLLLLLGARFDFTLDEDLKVAAACDDVKNALAAKISRERIGTEVRSNSSLSSLGITFIETCYDKICHTFCLY
jgi:hypothetical protein